MNSDAPRPIGLLRGCVALALCTHDDDFLYDLPFESGQRFLVSQGYGGTYSHTGLSYYSLDFRMPLGTPICAARSGVIITVIDHYSEGGTDPRYKGKANRIEILHGDGSSASYLHLARDGVLVKSGMRVCAGDVIGLSGSTGWSEGPHLHFHVAGGSPRLRLPTKFRTAEGLGIYLEQGRFYVRPGKRTSQRIDNGAPTPARIPLVGWLSQLLARS